MILNTQYVCQYLQCCELVHAITLIENQPTKTSYCYAKYKYLLRMQTICNISKHIIMIN